MQILWNERKFLLKKMDVSKTRGQGHFRGWGQGQPRPQGAFP